MEYLLICAVALLTSMLTFFSGFGLGTLLLPAFAVFFSTEVAVALTAVVHFLNNLFKLTLIGRHARGAVVLRFGIPALLAAYGGAQGLLWLADLPPLLRYNMFSGTFFITPVNLTIAVLMTAFAVVELRASEKNFSLPPRYLPLGGILSGFFGGLSGHQGALRTMFLLRCGLSKESFIATGVMIACMVDVSRLLVYSERLAALNLAENGGLLLAATLAAFAGAMVGNRLLKKITMREVRTVVAVMLFGVALGLGLGII
ncbi:MAG: sulfite exporter TauE/SafE family protein [Calditrichaeota bacterium]|nr:MAG: sulfite exporter TauE/SafE family protein [Calditrichota bacterium]